MKISVAHNATPGIYYTEENNRDRTIPRGMYVDADGDFAVVGESGAVAFVVLNFTQDASTGLVTGDVDCLSYPIKPAPRGTKLEFVA